MTFDADDIRFLETMARDVVEASRVRPGQRVAGSPPNTLGRVLIRPGGRDCYPAVWVRDFAMSLDSGFITPVEAADHLELIARAQNGPKQRKLRAGAAVIPPYAVPDHINFDGGAVFYPGAYSAGDDQGGEPFGVLPPADDHFYFIDIAHHLFALGRADVLEATADRPPLRDPLSRAFDAVETDPATGGMVRAPADRRAVGFGFCDTVYLTGSILFPSLLRWRAARQMTRMFPATAAHYARIAEDIATHLAPVFADPGKSGWLLAATDVGRRPDVWGTLYALYLGVLAPDDATAARHAIIEATRAGTITLEGGVRHVPTTHDASPASAWDRTANIPINTYQNGAYWHTASGWLLFALYKHEPVLARKVFAELIAHLRGQDFRKGAAFGAPWECFHRDGAARQNAVYMASVTVPLAAVRKIEG